jgi:hypothetical protein
MLLPLFQILFPLFSSNELTFSLCLVLSLSYRGLHRYWVILFACAVLVRLFG